MPASQARRLCPTAIVIPPDFTAYREKSREVWALVARAARAPAVDGARRGLRRPDRRREAAARAARADRRGASEQTGIQISVGVGPSRLVAKCCSRPRQARRLRRDGPRGGVHPLRHRADAPAARASARRPPSAWPSSATRTVGPAPGGRRGASWPRRFGDRTARYLKARASFHDDSPVETERGAAKSVSTERTFDEDIASHEELETILRTLSRELCEGLQRKARQRPHGRDQGPARRLDDGHPRPHAAGRRRNDTALVTETALELLRAYAPPQPVRLLGVRLAAFDDVEPDSRRRRPRRSASSLPLCAQLRASQYSAVASLRRDVARERVRRRRARRARRRRPCAARPCASPSAGGDRRDQRVQARLGLARVERGERRRAAPGRPREPQARGEAVGGERARRRWPAAPAPPRGRRRRPASARAGPRRRRGRARARARGAGRPRCPAATSPSASEGTRPSRKRSTCAGGSAPMNSSTTLPSLNAFTAGIDWIPKAWERRGLASVSTFTSSTWPSRLATAFSSTGLSGRHGPHHSAQKSTTTGCSWERWMTSRSKVSSVASMGTLRG